MRRFGSANKMVTQISKPRILTRLRRSSSGRSLSSMLKRTCFSHMRTRKSSGTFCIRHQKTTLLNRCQNQGHLGRARNQVLHQSWAKVWAHVPITAHRMKMSLRKCLLSQNWKNKIWLMNRNKRESGVHLATIRVLQTTSTKWSFMIVWLGRRKKGRLIPISTKWRCLTCRLFRPTHVNHSMRLQTGKLRHLKRTNQIKMTTETVREKKRKKEKHYMWLATPE